MNIALFLVKNTCSGNLVSCLLMKQGIYIEELNLFDYPCRSQTEKTRIGDDF